MNEKFSNEMLELNKEYRRVTGKREGYFFQNFVCEGKIVYVLDDKGEAQRNAIFKFKPADFSLDVHWFVLLVHNS